MKLAILAQTYLHDTTSQINGTLVQLDNLSKAFVKRGIEVHYVCCTNDKNKPVSEKLHGIHFHWIQRGNGYLDWYFKCNTQVY